MEKQFTFHALPRNVAELQATPEAAMRDPFAVAALTVAALCRYEADRDSCIAMLNCLRGPRPLSVFEVQSLRDRLGGKGYKPFSFFAGAVPANDYTPDEPFTVTVSGNSDGPDPEGYCRVMLRSGGADSPRPVTLRRMGDGTWRLWEQILLSDIRIPKSEDPWA